MSSTLTDIIAKPNRLVALLTTAVALALFVIPAPEGVAPNALKGVALGLFAVGLYGTAAIPEHLTALMFFTIAMIFAVAPANVVFSGFHSGAFWLVFGGMIVGVAVQKTGLGVKLATLVTSRLSGTYRSLVVGVAMVGLGLAFVMPSTMGRIVMLAPIVIALCDELGFEPGSKERAGLILAMACGTWMPSSGILPSNVPNMILIGVAETLFDMSFTYGNYMLVHLPVNGLLKTVLIIGIVIFMFPSRSGTKTVPSAQDTPIGSDGRRLAVILALTLGFWATDFIHGISPAWIALAAGMACLAPGIGLVTSEELRTKVNFPTAIYVAGILSLGAVLVETGAGDWIGGYLLDHLPLDPDAPLRSFFAIVGLGTVINMASTAPSVPAIVGPLAGELSQASGLPLRTVLMTQVIAYSTVILPYQVPPLIVAMQLGGVSMRDGAKMTVALAIISLVVLVPLNFLWWSFLGMI